ncbi:C2H2 finger domain-containing protein [Blastomyces gilchristii SLH14081]|uniref:C2H2 finger domain-containing protein n=1 Tax=Blastomyces gilchristii (strain SLH14081) TaxID=559298 RepID=A0A179V1I6_BLAGS|nr:C2H2 finger domain-containing protein [Blastomyces gilchristii SLH14081]OAT13319.1 C2H2 finger domain-containing protein [Blastomyces gilchristii SLH14081]
MPRAEVGSTKYLSNKLKSKGLQRLRWYCQVCERQMRDENGFKCHTQSESHVRQMLLVGEDPRKYIQQYSNDFLSDFLKQLRTSHGEKSININHFYQEYIANKEHIHMNATRWPSLTEFAKYLGREGICRVEEGEKGIFISWIDNSPEALRRQDALRKREMQDRGDEERERKMIEEQVRRAQRDRELAGRGSAEKDDAEAAAPKELQRTEGEKIKLNFAPSKGTATPISASASASASPAPPNTTSQDRNSQQPTTKSLSPLDSTATTPAQPTLPATTATATTTQSDKPSTSLKLSAATSKPKNVFAAASKKNALTGAAKKKKVEAPPRPLTATERIMKEDMERKRAREERSKEFGNGGFNFKKQKIA